jgi:transposase
MSSIRSVMMFGFSFIPRAERNLGLTYKFARTVSFRFLKDPLFFVSSLFVKKPNRIEGLLMVMTLALLVYSVAQRRLRMQLATHQETVPNQINQPTTSPTLRWVFQLLEGIHRVRMTLQGQVHDLIEGLNDVQIKILRLFGNEVCRLYQISTG